VSLTGLRGRLERLETRDSGFVVSWTCPACGARCLRYQYGEPCTAHELAPPTRPGERVIRLEWRGGVLASPP
jgi:hypothetical protein